MFQSNSSGFSNRKELNFSSKNSAFLQKDGLFSSTKKSSLTRSSYYTADLDDDLEDADDLGKLKPSESFEDSSEADNDDPVYYKFRLKKEGALILEVENHENDDDEVLKATLLDKRGKKIESIKIKSDKRKTLLLTDQEPGTYYLRFAGEGENIDYEFELSTAPDTDDSDDDDDDD